MAVIINSKFNPYSLQELLTPYQAYGEEYRAQEAELNDLNNKASVWEGLADPTKDKLAYSRYQQFNNDLEKQASLIATEGLNSGSRKAMLDLKSRYSSDIIPIENAFNTRKERAKEYYNALSKDPTLLSEFDPSTLSLDSYLNNPEVRGQSYSGQLLTSQVGNMAKQLATQIRENPRKWDSILGGQYFETNNTKGYSDKEILEVINSSSKGSDILRSMVDDVISSSGISSWTDNNNIINKAVDYAKQGLWQAIGDTQFNTLSDKSYNPNSDIPNSDIPNSDIPTSKLNFINPKNIYTQNEVDRRIKDNKTMDILKKNIGDVTGTSFEYDQFGNIDISKIDMDKMLDISNKVNTRGSSIGTYPTTYSTTAFMDTSNIRPINVFKKDWETYQAIRPFLISQTTEDGNSITLDSTEMSEYFKDLENYNSQILDTTKNIVYDFPLDSSMNDVAKQTILQNVGISGLHKASFDSDKGYIKREEMNVADFNDDYKIVGVEMTKGKLAFVTLDKNNKKEVFLIPEGINPVAQDNIKQAYLSISEKDKILYNPKNQELMDKFEKGLITEEMLGSDGILLNTIIELSKLREARNNELSNTQLQIATLFNTNKVTPTNYKDITYNNQ